MTVGRSAATPPRTAESPGTGDLVSGGLAVVFGAAVVLYVRGFPRLSDGAPGPALFPGILGGLFVLFGSVLVVRWFRARHVTTRTAPSAERPGSPTVVADAGSGGQHSAVSAGTAWVNAGSVVGAVVLYLLLAEVIGFALAMGLLLFGLSWRLGARPWAAAISAVVTTSVLYVMFERVLLVPLPAGFAG